MKGKLIVGVGIVALVVMVGLMLLGFIPKQAAGDLAPDEVVTRFYDWYLGYVGEGEMRRNPLVDGAYRSSEFLSEDFVAEIDEMLASFDKGGFDPLLLAQDVPVRVQAGEAVVSGDEASVMVELFWGGNPTPSERIVSLALVDGQWKITGVGIAE